METAEVIPLERFGPPPQPCAICEWRLKAAVWLLEALANREAIPEKRDLLSMVIGLLAMVSPPRQEDPNETGPVTSPRHRRSHERMLHPYQ